MTEAERRIQRQAIEQEEYTQLIQAQIVARAKAPRVDISSNGKLERASKVYRKLAAKYHPDHNPATAEVMKDLNELWQALKNA